MSGFYTLAYAVGLRPWEQAGLHAAAEFSHLLDREISTRPAPPGRAADLGCGTGAHTIELANRGWQAVGVDNQPRALRIARARAAACHADVTFVHGDVTALHRDDIGGAADFFLDVGCFHHLPGPGRQAMAAAITAAAAPAATLLLLAFSPARRGPLPAGASREEIQTTFPGWQLLDDQPADASGMPRPLQSSAPHWYRLRLEQSLRQAGITEPHDTISRVAAITRDRRTGPVRRFIATSPGGRSAVARSGSETQAGGDGHG